MQSSKTARWTVITDDEALEPGCLEKAWESKRSILLAPLRRGVDVPWFERVLSHVPPSLSEGHYALLTSGSTGEPKLIVGSKTKTERLARIIHDAQRNESVERTVVLLPLTYSYAFVNQWLWAHVHTRRVDFTRGASDSAYLINLLRDEGSTMLCLVGPLFSLIKAAIPKGYYFDSVLRVNFAGAPFPNGQLAAVREIFPNAEVFNNYGCAEALPRLTITPAAEIDGVGDIGAPLPGIVLRVDDYGELCFRSDYGAVGVVAGDVWRAVRPDDWLKTEDLAAENDGRFRLLGRRSAVYKRYGEKISTSLQIEAVREVWVGDVVSIPAFDTRGEAGHLILLSPPPSDEQVRQVLTVFRRRFTRAQWPLRIESVDVMPITQNGKLDATALVGVPRQVHWKQIE